jgi:hypothetical protein
MTTSMPASVAGAAVSTTGSATVVSAAQTVQFPAANKAPASNTGLDMPMPVLPLRQSDQRNMNGFGEATVKPRMQPFRHRLTDL